MNYYIQEKGYETKIFPGFRSSWWYFPYHWCYEGFLDLTSSNNHSIPDQTLDQTKFYPAAAPFTAIWKKTGIMPPSARAMPNPLLARVRPGTAKQHARCVANYPTDTQQGMDFGLTMIILGIGHRTATRLKKLGIHLFVIWSLNPLHPQKEMGSWGLQLWFHASLVDESNVHKPYHVKSHGLGIANSFSTIIGRQADTGFRFPRYWAGRHSS